MKIGLNNIHTGKMLGAVIKQQHISHPELAKLIDRIPLSVKQYTVKKTLQTGVMIEICYALKHNFLADLADKLPQEFTRNQPNADALLKEKEALIEQLQEENKVLKIRN